MNGRFAQQTEGKYFDLLGKKRILSIYPEDRMEFVSGYHKGLETIRIMITIFGVTIVSGGTSQYSSFPFIVLLFLCVSPPCSH